MSVASDSGVSEPGGIGLVRPGRGLVRGGLSVEFLGVAGGLASLVGLVVVPLPVALRALTGHCVTPSRAVVAIMSFANGLVMARFDLAMMRRLKLTISFVLATRFVCVPVLAHLLASVLLPGIVVETGAATALSSSLLLLSLSPVGYSPPIAMLSPFMYPTLLAHLSLLTTIFFPILPAISYGVNVLLNMSALFGTVPLVAPPPDFLLLVFLTSIPALIALAAARVLPRRWVAVAGLCALPCAWACSAFLVGSALTRSLATSSVAGLVTSIGLCGGIVFGMALLGRLLSKILGLDVRARRTLILYLCSQGSAAAAGLAPGSISSAPIVAATAVGLGTALGMAKRWRKVVVRTCADHL
jgi:hypothetical protein